MNKSSILTEKDNSLVDIILPNYNKSAFIKEAIDSILNQTYKNWHLYIIDDHSIDNSRGIINTNRSRV